MNKIIDVTFNDDVTEAQQTDLFDVILAWLDSKNLTAVVIVGEVEEAPNVEKA